MFKSSFAQDLLQETRQQRSLTEEILPKEIRGQAGGGGGGGGYKSQFAASTHGPLDTVTVEDTEVREVTRRPGSVINESGHELGGLGLGGHTSDLGTSDFSSSELWPGPGSTSSSPFEYSPRYRSREASASILAEPAPTNTRLTSTSSSSSFLNLQSSMQFSYLKRVRRVTNRDCHLISNANIFLNCNQERLHRSQQPLITVNMWIRSVIMSPGNQALVTRTNFI